MALVMHSQVCNYASAVVKLGFQKSEFLEICILCWKHDVRLVLGRSWGLCPEAIPWAAWVSFRFGSRHGVHPRRAVGQPSPGNVHRPACVCEARCVYRGAAGSQLHLLLLPRALQVTLIHLLIPINNYLYANCAGSFQEQPNVHSVGPAVCRNVPFVSWCWQDEALLVSGGKSSGKRAPGHGDCKWLEVVVALW